MRLSDFVYSPGYCDMRGAYYRERLEKRGEDVWVVVAHARKYFDAPTVVSTYEVSCDALRTFEEYLAESGVLSLAGRKNSDEFITDYSPWEFCISFDGAPEAPGQKKRYRISQYREYSREDRSLIEDLKKRFCALRGAKIAETEEKDG